MDIVLIRKKLLNGFVKYKYVVIVLAVGIVLMLLPNGNKQSDQTPLLEPQSENLRLNVTAEQLKSVLCQIKGAGDVDVLLTYASSQRTVFHTNERSTSSESGGTQEYETVLITDGNRTEEALVVQELAPQYLGAVIVCEGAQDPSVKLAISEAVSKATGLGTDRISVLMMK